METEQLITGALFDFAAHLTTGNASITVGREHEVPPLIEALSEWAGQRALDLENNPAVQDWQEHVGVPAARTVMRKAFEKDHGFYIGYHANVSCLLHDLGGMSWDKANKLAHSVLKLVFDINLPKEEEK